MEEIIMEESIAGDKSNNEVKGKEFSLSCKLKKDYFLKMFKP